MTEKSSPGSLDDFYTTEFILQKERFYGINYSSSGGETATKDLLLHAGLQPGEKVLDIGCGQGGPSMYMARHYGLHVHGIDLSQNLINLAKQRLAACEPIVQERVQFEYADVTTVQLKRNYYDVIYSKESITMISDKNKLYENCMSWVRPGGKLFISDYCSGEIDLSKMNSKGYQIPKQSINLATASDTVHYMEAAGFKNVKAEDLTKNMINYWEDSLRHFRATKQAFIQDFDLDSYQAIDDQFSQRISRGKEGITHWVLFTATA